MDVIGATYNTLAADGALTARLATAPYGGPAIYEAFVPETSEWPCVVIRWEFNIQEPYVKQHGTLTLDIFVTGDSSQPARAIRNDVIRILNQSRLDAGDDGMARYYLDYHGGVPEEPGTNHWLVEFTVVFYSPALI